MCCNDSPNYDGMNRAAEANAGISKESLDWAKQVYGEQAPLRAAAADRANKVSDAQLRAMDTATNEAELAGDYRRQVYEPLERSIVQDAKDFDTEGKRQELAGLALGDVNQQFGAARQEAARGMTRMGVNPNDGKFAAVNGALTQQQALAGADAMNKSRMGAITLGRAMKMDAAGLGRNLATNQATQAGLALNAGNSSAANGQTPVQLAQNATGIMQNGFNTAIQGNNSAGNIYGNVASLQQKDGDGVLGGLAGLGMAAGSMGWRPFGTSDKKQKRDIKSVKDETALAQARKMPVAKWKYREDSAAADGGQEHVGPMAQDVRAAAGEQMAPGGKMIDLISMNGMTLAAVKALDKKVARLEKKAKA